MKLKLRILNFFLALIFSGNLYSQSLDSLKISFENTNNLIVKKQMAYDIAARSLFSEPNEGIRYIRFAYKQSHRDTQLIHINTYNLFGLYHQYFTENLDSAVSIYTTGLYMARKNGNLVLIKKLSTNLGQTYVWLGQFADGLENQLEALKISIELNSADSIKEFVNVGNCYSEMGKDSLAMYYYRKAYKEVSNINTSLTANLLNSMGTIYTGQNKLDSADTFFERSIAIRKELGLEKQNLNTLINLAALKSKRQLMYQSLELYKEVLRITKEHKGNNQSRKIALHNMANSYMELEQYDSAVIYLYSVLHEYDLSDDYRVRIPLYYKLFNSYLYLKNSDSAKKYADAYFSLKDELYTAEYNEKIADAEVKFQTAQEQRKAEKLAFKLAQQKQKQKLVKQQFLFWISIGVMILVIVLITAYLFYRNKKQKELSQSLFMGQQNERIRIARDLHDGVGQMLVVIKTQASAGEVKHTELIDKTIAEVRDISHGLMPQALNFGLSAAIEELSESINDTESTKISSSVTILSKLEKEVELTTYRIIQEVLSNILKHSSANDIKIGIKETKGLLEVYIEDNGINFNRVRLALGDGIGWNNLRHRVKAVNGNISFTGARNQGNFNMVRITLPIN